MSLNKAYGILGIFFAPSTTGRYWPLSQFISSLVTQVFGNNVLFQWGVQYLLFIVMTLLVWRIAWLFCRNRYIAFGAVIFCICATPMSENVFTIGKAEITLSVMMLLSLIFMLDILNGGKRRASYILFCIFTFLSFISKETSVILLPMLILIGIYVFCFLTTKTDTRRATIILILECSCAYIVYCILKCILVKDDSYSAYEMEISMVLKGAKYYLKYCWDIMLIGLLSLVPCIKNLCVQKKTAKNQENINQVTLAVILNIVGWGYFAGICLWRFSHVYYAFPSVIFFAPSFAISLQLIMDKKKVMICWGSLIAIALIYGGWNGYLVSSATRDVSSSFSESVDFMLRNEQISGKIYAENYMFFEESPYQMNRLFDLYGKDLEVVGIKEMIEGTTVSDETLRINGYTKEKYMTKRSVGGVPQIGDYVLLYENIRNNWLPCRKTNPSNEGEEKLEQLGLVLERVAGNQIKRNRHSLSLKGIREVDELTGWSIYRVIGNQSGISLDTEWEDWLGEDNTIISIDSENYTQIVLEGAYEHSFSDLNTTCRITDGRTLPCELVIDEGKGRYQLIINIKGSMDSELRVRICFSNSFIPSQVYSDSNDQRKLTVRIPDRLYMTN